MVRRVKFFRRVTSRPQHNLGGWKKNQSTTRRRMLAIASRPDNWNLRTKRRSAGRALMALANVTRDKPTRIAALADARYFFRLIRKK